MTKLTGFQAPKFTELRGTSKSYYEGELGQGVTVGQGPVPAMPYIDGMLAHGAYGYLDYIAAQTMVLYAAGDNLDGHGFTYQVPRIQASRAIGSVDVSGLAGYELSVPQTARDKNGTEFKLSESVVLDGAGSAVAVFVAVAPGAAGNVVGAASLTLTSPVEGVDPVLTAASAGFSGGADKEEDGRPGIKELYRGRILDVIRQPPHGGNSNDYTQWAKSVAGVSRVWVSPREMGLGTVTVRFMMDVLRADLSGIPTVADVTLVQSYIDGERQVTADVFVVAPIPKPIDITISGLDPDTPETRTAIEDEIRDMLYRRGAPGVTISRSWLIEATAIAAGENRHKMTVPADDVECAIGEIPVLGVVSYVE
ncbi:baseplate J/gp47 family protein [Thalassospira lucentensis]|uniref:baseplate J/gp47 family protein n=1 Tax=Thalassospira lucentensis TaxID=168935 RepID=UPI003D2ADDDF